MNVRFASAAYRELAEAAEYYEGQQCGLADRFLSAVEEAVERIMRHPVTWVRVSPRIRRCFVQRFLFALFNHVTGEDIQIVAVADLKRDPARWERLL